MPETWVRSLGREDPLEKEMATPSSILAWEIPRTEELGGIQYMRQLVSSYPWLLPLGSTVGHRTTKQ